MRTSAPRLLPLFRSEMQIGMLGLLLLQPERTWTLDELSDALRAPTSSVHRELGRTELAGIVRRDSSARPHRFTAATNDPLYDALVALLRQTVGVEQELKRLLDRPDVEAATIHGSWAGGPRLPDSDIDLLVVGDADLRELRRLVRRTGKAVGRTIDLTVLAPGEWRELAATGSSLTRQLLEGSTIPLIGNLASLARS